MTEGDNAKELFRLWSSKRAGTALPTRDNLGPVELAELASHLVVIDLPSENFLRLRYFGSALEKRDSQDFSGHNLFDIYHPEQRLLVRTLFQAMTRRPCGLRGILEHDPKSSDGPYCRKFLTLPIIGGKDSTLIFLNVDDPHDDGPGTLTDQAGLRSTLAPGHTLMHEYEFVDIGFGVD